MHSHNKRSRYYQRNTSVNLVAVGGEAMRSRRRQPEKLVTCTCPVKTFHDTVMARSCLPLSGKCPGLVCSMADSSHGVGVTSRHLGRGMARMVAAMLMPAMSTLRMPAKEALK